MDSDKIRAGSVLPQGLKGPAIQKGIRPPTEASQTRTTVPATATLKARFQVGAEQITTPKGGLSNQTRIKHETRYGQA